MARLTYLEMVQRILRRVNSTTTVTDVSTMTGRALVIGDMVNEAQQSIHSEAKWNSTYASRTFTSAAGSATVTTATDWASTIDISDNTNNRVLQETSLRSIDESNMGRTVTNTPTHFAVADGVIHFNWTPAGAANYTERYWRDITPFTANGDVSILPDYCDNIMLYWAEAMMHEHLNEFDTADRVRRNGNNALERAKKANKRLTDEILVFGTVAPTRIQFAQLPSNFGQR